MLLGYGIMIVQHRELERFLQHVLDIAREPSFTRRSFLSLSGFIQIINEEGHTYREGFENGWELATKRPLYSIFITYGSRKNPLSMYMYYKKDPILEAYARWPKALVGMVMDE